MIIFKEIFPNPNTLSAKSCLFFFQDDQTKLDACLSYVNADTTMKKQSKNHYMIYYIMFIKLILFLLVIKIHAVFKS